MMKADEVEAMLGLYELGWGTKRIAAEFGSSRNTVKRYVEAQGWVSYGGPRRGAKLAGLDEWLEERLFRHRGNAEVVRQDLENELSIGVSLRTVERAVVPHRRRLAAEAKATQRYETPPGRQLQIDFGTSRVPLGGEAVRVHLFVATLGYSRRNYVQAFAHERQAAWCARRWRSWSTDPRCRATGGDRTAPRVWRSACADSPRRARAAAGAAPGVRSARTAAPVRGTCTRSCGRDRSGGRWRICSAPDASNRGS